MTRFVDPVPKYTDQSNDFMPYGLLYFFDSGTNDDKTTFADVNETIANTQPLILNGDGSVPNCFFSGSAKVVLVTNAGTPSAPVDGTQQWERDPVTAASIGAIGRVWDAISIYDVDSVVIHNTIFYVSIINSNQNNNPTSSRTAWTQFDLLKRFNTNETYNLGDPVIASNDTMYLSRIASNTGNDPISSPTQWRQPGQSISGNLNPIAWGVFNFDTDTLTSGDGCTVVRNGIGNASITLDSPASAAINTLIVTNGINDQGFLFSTTQGFLLSLEPSNNSKADTIPNGSTTRTISHSFGSLLPIHFIMVTPNETLGSASYMYVSAVTSTNFTVAVDVDPGKDVDFGVVINSSALNTDVSNFAFAVYDTEA